MGSPVRAVSYLEARSIPMGFRKVPKRFRKMPEGFSSSFRKVSERCPKDPLTTRRRSRALSQDE